RLIDLPPDSRRIRQDAKIGPTSSALSSAINLVGATICSWRINCKITARHAPEREGIPMPDVKTSRPFRERFLNGFDRSELRQEVQAVKPKRCGGMRKKYAAWALGASLALGGIGAPMKVIHDNAAAKTAS